MPGAVPQTSTQALTQATLPYALLIANMGWESACQKNEALKKGLAIQGGVVLDQQLINLFNL
jgi:alanine dehydrogenase